MRMGMGMNTIVELSPTPNSAGTANSSFPAQSHTANACAYHGRYRSRYFATRPGCKEDAPWACPPTHVAWTSGTIGGPKWDPSVKWQTEGWWGHQVVSRLGAPTVGISPVGSEH